MTHSAAGRIWWWGWLRERKRRNQEATTAPHPCCWSAHSVPGTVLRSWSWLYHVTFRYLCKLGSVITALSEKKLRHPRSRVIFLRSPSRRWQSHGLNSSLPPISAHLSSPAQNCFWDHGPPCNLLTPWYFWLLFFNKSHTLREIFILSKMICTVWVCF